MMKKIIACLLLLGYLTTGNAQFSVEKGNIPASFSGFSKTLIIEALPTDKHSKYFETVNNILEKRFTKFYKGDFEIVEDGYAAKGKYKSEQTHPFVIKLILDHPAAGGGTYYYRFLLQDRVNKREYLTDVYPDSTIPPYSFINAYAKALEKLRAKE